MSRSVTAPPIVAMDVHMGGMTIRFFRTNPLMERGEKRSEKGERAIGVFSPPFRRKESGVQGSGAQPASHPNRNTACFDCIGNSFFIFPPHPRPLPPLRGGG